jgi:hypothetical protein
MYFNDAKMLLPDAVDAPIVRSFLSALANPSEDLSITRLAGLSCLSTIHSLRLFKKEHKETLHQFVDFRMEDGTRWLTMNPPDPPDLEIVLAEPAAPMLGKDFIPHVQALLARNSLGGAWETPNRREAFEELEAKGVVFIKEPTEEFWRFRNSGGAKIQGPAPRNGSGTAQAQSLCLGHRSETMKMRTTNPASRMPSRK